MRAGAGVTISRLCGTSWRRLRRRLSNKRQPPGKTPPRAHEPPLPGTPPLPDRPALRHRFPSLTLIPESDSKCVPMNINKENIPPLREQFRARLIDLRLPAKTHPYLANWAESFMEAKAYRAAENSHAYFAALSRSAHLVLERNVAPSTQKQTLNALVFLHRAVFQHGEFIIQTPQAPREYQRPPTILSRPEVHELFGESSTRTSSRTTAPPSTSRAPSSVNILMPPASSRGPFSSRPPNSAPIPAPGNSPGITSS
ncbi:MAG: hypothetical protein ACJAVK_000788 [Akkermansiaceae bacterium]|jgi:hypothetical protein